MSIEFYTIPPVLQAVSLRPKNSSLTRKEGTRWTPPTEQQIHNQPNVLQTASMILQAAANTDLVEAATKQRLRKQRMEKKRASDESKFAPKTQPVISTVEPKSTEPKDADAKASDHKETTTVENWLHKSHESSTLDKISSSTSQSPTSAKVDNKVELNSVNSDTNTKLHPHSNDDGASTEAKSPPINPKKKTTPPEIKATSGNSELFKQDNNAPSSTSGVSADTHNTAKSYVDKHYGSGRFKTPTIPSGANQQRGITPPDIGALAATAFITPSTSRQEGSTPDRNKAHHHTDSLKPSTSPVINAITDRNAVRFNPKYIVDKLFQDTKQPRDSRPGEQQTITNENKDTNSTKDSGTGEQESVPHWSKLLHTDSTTGNSIAPGQTITQENKDTHTKVELAALAAQALFANTNITSPPIQEGGTYGEQYPPTSAQSGNSKTVVLPPILGLHNDNPVYAIDSDFPPEKGDLDTPDIYTTRRSTALARAKEALRRLQPTLKRLLHMPTVVAPSSEVSSNSPSRQPGSTDDTARSGNGTGGGRQQSSNPPPKSTPSRGGSAGSKIPKGLWKILTTFFKSLFTRPFFAIKLLFSSFWGWVIIIIIIIILILCLFTNVAFNLLATVHQNLTTSSIEGSASQVLDPQATGITGNPFPTLTLPYAATASSLITSSFLNNMVVNNSLVSTDSLGNILAWNTIVGYGLQEKYYDSSVNFMQNINITVDFADILGIRDLTSGYAVNIYNYEDILKWTGVSPFRHNATIAGSQVTFSPKPNNNDLFWVELICKDKDRCSKDSGVPYQGNLTAEFAVDWATRSADENGDPSLNIDSLDGSSCARFDLTKPPINSLFFQTAQNLGFNLIKAVRDGLDINLYKEFIVAITNAITEYGYETRCTPNATTEQQNSGLNASNRVNINLDANIISDDVKKVCLFGNAPLTEVFRCTNGYNPSNNHFALDLQTTKSGVNYNDEVIYSPVTGQIISRSPTSWTNACGAWILIQENETNTHFLISHLDEKNINNSLDYTQVNRFDTSSYVDVQAGDPIGTYFTSNTNGYTSTGTLCWSGPHIHFGVWPGGNRDLGPQPVHDYLNSTCYKNNPQSSYVCSLTSDEALIPTP